MNPFKHDNVHADLLGKRKVYSEAAYNRLREALYIVQALSELTAPDVRLNALMRISETCDTALQEVEG